MLLNCLPDPDVPDEEIPLKETQVKKPELFSSLLMGMALLSLSHELTAPKKCNPKASSKNPGDSVNGKEKETDEG